MRENEKSKRKRKLSDSSKDQQPLKHGRVEQHNKLSAVAVAYPHEKPKFQKLSTKPDFCVEIVILVVNDVEFETVTRHLEPCTHTGEYWKYSVPGFTFLLGRICGKRVAISKSKQGSGGGGGATQVARACLDTWQPRVMVALGVAFGTPEWIEPRNQGIQYGDVLLSTSIVPYEHQRITKGEPSEYRRQPTAINRLVVQKLEQAMDTDERILRIPRNITGAGITQHVQVRLGAMLSGDKLLDDEKFHENLVNSLRPRVTTSIIGGDMEGVALADVCEVLQGHFVVIKGVCDWGYGKEKRFHRQAAKAAMLFFEKIIDELCDVPKLVTDCVEVPHSGDKMTIDRNHPLVESVDKFLEAYSILEEVKTERKQRKNCFIQTIDAELEIAEKKIRSQQAMEPLWAQLMESGATTLKLADGTELTATRDPKRWSDTLLKKHVTKQTFDEMKKERRATGKKIIIVKRERK